MTFHLKLGIDIPMSRGLEHRALENVQFLNKAQEYGRLKDPTGPSIDSFRPFVKWAKESKVNPQDIKGLSEVVQGADYIINTHPEVKNRFFESVPYNEGVEKVVKAKNRHSLELAKISRDNPNVLIALPMMGAYSFQKSLISRGISPDSILPVYIDGSAGQSSGASVLKEPLPETLKDLSKPVVMVDDVGDTIVTGIVLAMERLKLANQDLDKISDYARVLQEIKRHRAKDNPLQFTEHEFLPLYREAASLFRKANMIFAPLYIKNSTVRATLYEEAGRSDKSSWGLSQLRMLDQAVLVPESMWLMGGKGVDDDGLLDTGIQVNDLSPYLRAVDRKYIKKHTLGNITLRLGAGIRELLALKDQEGYKKQVAKVLSVYIDSQITPK